MKTHITDVVIVGSGPSGLSAAVNASSEGLQTLVIESENKIGGQAKESSRIENYLGFPSGLTGPKLMSRSFSQAKKFGTKFLLGISAISLEIEGHYRTLELSNGDRVISRAIVLANGLQWRKHDAAGIEDYTGKGVYYGLNMDTAPKYSGENVAVVGSANSAGQAITYLSQFAHSFLIVRSSSLSDMSTYLRDRVEKNSNITIKTETVVTSVSGDGEKLTEITLNNSHTLSQEKTEVLPVSALFLFIGAIPKTQWINGKCEMDSDGFVITNDYQTTCSGIFAIGDVRANSVKRISAAVGDGSAVVSRIHKYLMTLGV